MAKFEAMMDLLSIIVPYIERDAKGQLIRDQSIVFNPGVRIRDKVTPANISTTDPSILVYLRAYGGNEANGGTSFSEVIEKKSEVKSAKAPAVIAEPAKVTVIEEVEEEKEFVFPNDLAETPTESSYPEVLTVQAASAILRGLYPELKSRDTSNREKVLQIATDKGISFPNLD